MASHSSVMSCFSCAYMLVGLFVKVGGTVEVKENRTDKEGI